MILTGSPTVNSSLTLGALVFPVLTGAAGVNSIRTKIREALAYGIKNIISKSNGYFFNIGEVHVNAVANNAKRKKYPSVDILWQRERYTNSITGGNSLKGHNKIASILLYGHLFEENCKKSPEDIVLMRENFVADMDKFFGINFFIPNSSGIRTAFNTIPINNFVNGIEATEPYGSVEYNIELYYRIEVGDPTQDF